ncbi:HNH endonuclease family protein [Longispora albida]|uniref:HNH endonuclease family protein n=1 Tax=Longispora albida TaxID=203523 RepID=UPI00039C84B2|nr:HNH endonuclease family protein [Longispora albida]
MARKVAGRELAGLLVVGAVALGAVLLLRGSRGEPPAPAPPVAAAEALSLLAGLRQETQSHWESYDRRAFGEPLWTDDTDAPDGGNGCDTRDDVLRRDIPDGDHGTGCGVRAGTLRDPYTGRELYYDRRQASEIETDHVVALGAAWRSGAWAWEPQRRRAFANDTGNLLAVSRAANQEKRSQTPDNWRPRREFWCGYASRYTMIKSRYELSVTATERDALADMLGTC